MILIVKKNSIMFGNRDYSSTVKRQLIGTTLTDSQKVLKKKISLKKRLLLLSPGLRLRPLCSINPGSTTDKEILLSRLSVRF